VKAAENADVLVASRVYRIWGELLLQLRRFETAEPVLEKALQLSRRAIGEQTALAATSLASLGAARLQLGKLDAARDDLEKALAITKATLGDGNPNYIEQISTLARILIAQGNAAEAEVLLEGFDAVANEHFGEHSDILQTATGTMALLYSELNRPAEALPYLAKTLDIRLNVWNAHAPALSDTEMLTYHEQTLDVLENWYAVVRQLRDETDPHNVYQMIWRARGHLVREQIRRRDVARIVPEVQQAYAELRAVRQLRADHYGNGAVAQWSAAWRKELSRLSDRKAELERLVAGRNNRWMQDRPKILVESVTPEGVLGDKRFPADAAIIEFIRTSDHYDVFVVRPNDSNQSYSVDWISLADATTVDRWIDAWRRHVAPAGQTRGFRRLPSESIDPSDRLREAIWAPIEQCLEGCSTAILIPDGELWRLPWPALPSIRQGHFLVQDYRLLTASHGTALYDSMTRQQANREGVLVVGGLDYGKATSADDWEPLDGSRRESEAIAKVWRGQRVVRLTDDQAIESSLREKLGTNRIVHLATHGAFSENLFQRSRPQIGNSADGPKVGRGTTRDQFLRSWIVLSGANVPVQLDERGLPVGPDGRLSAEEVMNLDLSKVDLVVLSGCETGLGNVIGGEGVFGLQRAFQLSGSKAVVASIWPVGDAATQAMMIRFHQNLASGRLSKLDALREAQIAMLRGKLPGIAEPPHLQDWAGWILSGDWR
ncbi:MAG: CHAT domain-containing protein, partial [Pirellulales bacterium]|nr:CHAT domain-containing protein [Pirellulales bacterium]